MASNSRGQAQVSDQSHNTLSAHSTHNIIYFIIIILPRIHITRDYNFIVVFVQDAWWHCVESNLSGIIVLCIVLYIYIWVCVCIFFVITSIPVEQKCEKKRAYNIDRCAQSFELASGLRAQTAVGSDDPVRIECSISRK